MNELSSAFGAVAGVVALAGFLALVNERVVEFVVRPLLAAVLRVLKRPEEEASKLLPYVAGAMGALVSWGFGLDLFAPLAAAVGLEPAAWVTRLLTALVVAGGSNLLHDVWPGASGAER